MREKNIITTCPILMYTSIIPYDDGNTNFCTTIEKFEADMKMLFSKGYNPISLHEVYECWDGKKNWKEKPICVVFIGGYENNYTLVFPILKCFDIPASIFIATDLVGVREYPNVENYSPHFDWKQAQEMFDSGLVQIYPMWHAFDKGNSVVKMADKMSFIRHNLQGGDPSFAIAFNGCTDEEFFLLRKMGVKICVTDISYINAERVKKGMLPSIYVEYTSDVMDVINRHEELCKEVLEKENAITHMARYIEPSANILAESVNLPIERNPIAKNYLRHAFPLSIMQAESKERAERYVLNEYIEVIYKPWDNWYDYHNFLYDSWDCLEYKRMTLDLLAENGINIVEYIIHALKLGYYCDVWLDTYYIPGKPEYKQRHMTHGILIFSYLAKEQEFCAMSYSSKGQYEELHIPIKAVYMGCSNRYFDYVNLIRNKTTTSIAYDLRELYVKLDDYLNSTCHDDNRRYNKKSSQQYYNYDATQKYIENCKKVAEKEQYIHLTSLYSFVEHKRIMMWRIKYIAEKEKLTLNFTEEYTSAIKTTEKLVNLGIKYNITHNERVRHNMESKMHQLCTDEKLAIVKLLAAIDKKLSL